MIDGRVIDDDRIDQTVKLGDTEEWTIVNTDQQYHSFHIHQTPFLVTEVNGVPQDEDSLRDTMPIPPATEERPGLDQSDHSVHGPGDRRSLRLSLSRGRPRR